MANKHIRYGNYVVPIVYTHTQGTHAHEHTNRPKIETLKGNTEGAGKGESKISLLSKTLYTGCSLQVKEQTQDKCQQKIR